MYCKLKDVEMYLLQVCSIYPLIVRKVPQAILHDPYMSPDHVGSVLEEYTDCCASWHMVCLEKVMSWLLP